jgi:hypothetical protein
MRFDLFLSVLVQNFWTEIFKSAHSVQNTDRKGEFSAGPENF